MHVKFHNRFFDELNAIKEFIAKDNVSRANSFVDDVFNKCLDLKDTPTAHRLSQKVKKHNARDLIFKGYEYEKLKIMRVMNICTLYLIKKIYYGGR